jgi:cytochrome c oxidase subunit 4
LIRGDEAGRRDEGARRSFTRIPVRFEFHGTKGPAMSEIPHALIREEIKERHVESHAPYFKVFLGLFVLTVIEYFYARVFKDYFTLLIGGLLFWAIIKAAMVGWYFMHLKFEGKWIYVLLIPTSFLVLVLVFALIPDMTVKTNASENSLSEEQSFYSIPAPERRVVDLGGVARPALRPIG